MSRNFIEAIKERRSIYAISKESPISDDKIVEIVEDVVKHVPSAFNSQTTRTVILLGEQHDKLWDITMEALRKIVSEKDFESTEARINSFKGGYGTVLFFEDFAVVKSLQEQFELYKDNFPVWALQTSGMMQFSVWTAFATEGIGGSLQHYTELIDEQVKKEFNIPESWKMLTQMPFGKIVKGAGEKAFNPIEDRVKVLR